MGIYRMVKTRLQDLEQFPILEILQKNSRNWRHACMVRLEIPILIRTHNTGLRHSLFTVRLQPFSALPSLRLVKIDRLFFLAAPCQHEKL